MTGTHAPDHLDYNDPASLAAASEMLRRHELGEPEANITTAQRDSVGAGLKPALPRSLPTMLQRENSTPIFHPWCAGHNRHGWFPRRT